MKLTIITMMLFSVSSAFIATRMGYASARLEAQQKFVGGRHRAFRYQPSAPVTGAVTFQQLGKMLKQAQQASSRRKYRQMVLFKRMQATVALYDN